MATHTPPVSDRIRKEARVVGLRGLQMPSLEAVERRRLQLWIVTAVLLVAVVVLGPLYGYLVWRRGIAVAARWVQPRQAELLDAVSPRRKAA